MSESIAQAEWERWKHPALVGRSPGLGTLALRLQPFLLHPPPPVLLSGPWEPAVALPSRSWCWGDPQSLHRVPGKHGSCISSLVPSISRSLSLLGTRSVLAQVRRLRLASPREEVTSSAGAWAQASPSCGTMCSLGMFSDGWSSAQRGLRLQVGLWGPQAGAWGPGSMPGTLLLRKPSRRKDSGRSVASSPHGSSWDRQSEPESLRSVGRRRAEGE